ncbi:MAG: TolC family protein [Nitrospirae bacterium]|nr:TolC family protein [Candidatus Manganitrophaceae bacterium]
MSTYRHLGVFVFTLFIFAPVLTWGAEQQGKRYTLEEVLALAEEKNPSIEIFRANLDAAQGSMAAARAYPNPELSVSLGRGKPLGSPGAGYEGEYGFGIGQPLEWPGKRIYRRKAAEAEVGVARQESDDFRLELRSQVKEAFFNLLLSKQILDVSRKNSEAAQSLISAARARVDSGEAPALELIKAQVELARVTKDLRRAENRIVLSKGALNSLLGGALSPGEDIVGDLSGARKHYNLTSLLEDAMVRHPLILRQKKAMEAAGYTLSRERQSLIPDLVVRGGFSEEIDKRSYSLGLSLVFPLFYQRQGEIAVARAGEARANAELDRARTELTRLVTQEYQNYQIALEQLTVFEEGLLKQADEALRIAQFSYQQGESGLLDLLDAQRVQRATLSEYYEAQFELDTALARLERATGGLPQ